MTFAERVEHLIQLRAGGSRVGFARLIGRPRLTVFRLLSPGYQPPLSVLQDVLRAFPDVDARWLLLGDGASDSGQLNALPLELERLAPKRRKLSGDQLTEV